MGGILERGLRLLGGGAKHQALYDRAIDALGNGEAAAARALIARLKASATSPRDRSLVTEAEAWAFLCEGAPARARELVSGTVTSSPLLLAVIAVVAGSNDGAIDTLADAMRAMPALELVTRALVACGAPMRIASLLERPGVATRLPDVWLQSASAVVFHSGAHDACEAICLAAFRAYGSPMHLFNAACCAARLGDVDRAFTHLRRALEAGFSERERFATDPDLANVRADARFAAL